MAEAIAFAGSALEAGGTIISANSQAKNLRREAKQLEAQAGTDRASSQRQAIEERRQADIASSRALLLAAASGGGASDPTIVNRIAALQGEGEYRALAAMYEGETSAQSKELQAKLNRSAAKATKTAGYLKAAGTILSAGSSLAGKYG